MLTSLALHTVHCMHARTAHAGSVVTNLLGADKGRDFWQELAGSKHALKRVAAPKEIAKFVCFLLSDEASFITGSVQPIDGGSEHLL
jgi:NAD(P)-dependent dehydrogenase (short-subunit alcohol dehydrogenase family)